MIVAGGYNVYSQFIKNPYSHDYDPDFVDPEFDDNDKAVISPPIKLNINISAISSYSVNENHTVMIMKNGDMLARGKNEYGEINISVSETVFDNFVKIELKNADGTLLFPISAYCGSNYIFYMASTTQDSGKNVLLLSSSFAKWHDPIILNIGDRIPVAIYGGKKMAAAIDNEGAILLISKSIIKSPFEEIKPLHLPDNEKAVSVALNNKDVISISSSGRIFMITSVDKSKNIAFEAVKQLEGINIVSISGYHDLFLAVSDDGKVFSYGNNKNGLFNPDSESYSHYRKDNLKFELVSSLSNFKIIDAYAGYDHLLFRTADEKVLACGNNRYGQLLLQRGMCSESIAFPTETIISCGAKFCIAATRLSVVFCNCDAQNSPNKKIKTDQQLKQINIEKKFIQNSQAKNQSSKIENEKIEQRNKDDDFESEIKLLTSENSKLKNEIEKQNQKIKENEIKSDSEIKILMLENSKLTKENEKLNQRIKELESKKETETTQSTSNSNEQNLFDISKIENMKELNTIGHNSKSKVTKVSIKNNFAFKTFFIKKTDGKYEKLKQLFQDSQKISNFNHPNIVKMIAFGYGNDNQYPWILLTFCPQNLNDIILEMNDLQRVCSIIEICIAMSFIHKNGLIHRDLKPENILFDELGHVKLSDIGTSNLIDVNEQTLQFLAPELLRGNEEFNEKVDVYSFGVVMYFILTKGKYPNIGIVDVSNGKKAQIPDFINDISRDLIMRCWSSIPNDRLSFNDIIEYIKNNEFKLIDGIENDAKKINEFIILEF